MTYVDRIIEKTAEDARTLRCLLCEYRLDVPPISVSETVAAALGMSGMTLAAVQVDQELQRASNDMRAHLKSHSVDDWIEAVP